MATDTHHRLRAALSEAARLMGQRKAGCVERPSSRKSEASRIAIQVARAVRYGRPEEAERLRWQHYPERMRREQLARERRASDSA